MTIWWEFSWIFLSDLYIPVGDIRGNHVHGRTEYGKGKPLLNTYSVQFSSVTRSCPTLCDPMDCSTPGFPVHHQLPELTLTHVPPVGDAIQPPHPHPPRPPFLLTPTFLSISLLQWVTSSHQVNTYYVAIISFRIHSHPLIFSHTVGEITSEAHYKLTEPGFRPESLRCQSPSCFQKTSVLCSPVM